MREIKTHLVDGAKEQVRIEQWENEPAPGGAPSAYNLFVSHLGSTHELCKIRFQKGALTDTNAPNGITNESLIAVVIDRLQHLQRGPLACRENAIAITKLEEALLWLQSRTRDRIARGVDNTLEK